jgi:hypothetical protein
MLRRWAVAWWKRIFAGKPVRTSNPDVIAWVLATSRQPSSCPACGRYFTSGHPCDQAGKGGCT